MTTPRLTIATKEKYGPGRLEVPVMIDGDDVYEIEARVRWYEVHVPNDIKLIDVEWANNLIDNSYTQRVIRPRRSSTQFRLIELEARSDRPITGELCRLIFECGEVKGKRRSIALDGRMFYINQDQTIRKALPTWLGEIQDGKIYLNEFVAAEPREPERPKHLDILYEREISLKRWGSATPAFAFDVILDKGKGVGALTSELHYDPDIFSLFDIEQSLRRTAGFMWNFNHNEVTPGRLRVGMACPVRISTVESRTMYHVELHVRDGAPSGTHTIELHHGSIRNPGYEDNVFFTARGITVEVP